VAPCHSLSALVGHGLLADWRRYDIWENKAKLAAAGIRERREGGVQPRGNKETRGKTKPKLGKAGNVDKKEADVASAGSGGAWRSKPISAGPCSYLGERLRRTNPISASVKFEVGSVKSGRRGSERSCFTLQTSHYAPRRQPCKTNPIRPQVLVRKGLSRSMGAVETGSLTFRRLGGCGPGCSRGVPRRRGRASGWGGRS